MRTELFNLLNNQIQEKKLVGSSATINENGVISIFCAGNSCVVGNNKMETQTIFDIGSITKVFTGFLASKLYLDGKINLNTKLGELNITSNEVLLNITLKDLLTHSSGLARLPSNLNPNDIRNPYSDYSLNFLIEELNSIKKISHASYTYSNLGFAVAGLMIEKMTGLSYEILLKENILIPLTLKNTYTELDASFMNKRATGYNSELEEQIFWTSQVFKPAGGLKSTIEDMSIFLSFISSDFSHPLRAAFDFSILTHFQSEDFNMGIGWHLGASGRELLTQDGATFGFYSKLRVSKQKNKGFIVLLNTYNDLSEAESIFEKYVGDS